MLNKMYQFKTRLRLKTRLRQRIKRTFLSNAEREHWRRHELVGPPALWRMKREFQIQFLKQMKLLPQHYLLDIGCGTLRGGVPIIDYLYTGHYFGVEARAHVLTEGRKEIQENGLDRKNPTLIVSDQLYSLEIDIQFDFIWAFSVLIHLTDDHLDDCLQLVSRQLGERGAFYANVNLGDRLEKSWQDFPVVWRSRDFYQERAAKHNLQLTVMGDLRFFGHQSGSDLQDSQTMLRFQHG